MTMQFIFWLLALTAQVGAFLIFKDLADISQWLIQSSRKFTMWVWYNRYLIVSISVIAQLSAITLWFIDPSVCHGGLLVALGIVFLFNGYSGLLNPRWMFRPQQHNAKFVSVTEAHDYMQQSLAFAHFGPNSYASVDDINVLVLETDNGAYAYSDYYLLQPHVVKGDSINGEPVIMTYCGLTNLGIAYSPMINQQPLDLTVMSQLKNNLVLCDKNSGEVIQQFWGHMENDPDKQAMKEWPTIRMPFKSFKTLYPDGKVFINEIARIDEHPILSVWDKIVRHGMMLWGVGLNWVQDDKPAFPTIDFTDKRLPMKELVYTISLNNEHVAYSMDFIRQQDNLIHTSIGGKAIVIAYDPHHDVVSAYFNPKNQKFKSVNNFGQSNDGTTLTRVNTLKSKIFWFIFIEFFPQALVNRV